MSISARSGGHSYAAYGLSGDIVIDMVKFKNITVNQKDFTARVETGNRLGEVATQIFAEGGRALPHGSCPYVSRRKKNSTDNLFSPFRLVSVVIHFMAGLDGLVVSEVYLLIPR